MERVGFSVFYTPEEVAELMQVRTETVHRWLREGQLKGKKVGGGRFWRVTEEAIREMST